MRIEHFALQIQDPVAFANWYQKNCGMTVAFKLDQMPNTHFLADSSGTVMVEVYNNTKIPVPDYASMDPLQLHLAFVSTDPQADRERLEAAGATFASEVVDGKTHLVMMRDPWGLAIQLCRRATPFLRA